MSLIPEILGKNGSLIERVLYPSMFNSPQAEPASPPPQATPAAPAVTASRPGLRGILESIFAGPSDPRLTDQQNQQAASQSMIQGGLATISAASQPGASAFGSVAEGAMFGQKARAENSEIIYGRTQAERVQNALNNPELVKLLTPAQRAAISMMSPAEAMDAIGKLAFTPAQLAAPGTAGYDAFGKQVFRNPAEAKAANVSSPMKDAMAEHGINTIEAYDAAPASLRQKISDRADQIRKTGASSVTVQNIPATVAKELNAQDLAQVGKIKEQAFQAPETLATLDFMDGLLETYPNLTGVGQEATMGLRGLLTSMGMDPGDLPAQEMYKKASNFLMFQNVKALGGRILQSEIRLMLQTVANVGMTAQANKTIIQMAKRVEQAKIERADMVDQWLADPSHKGTLSGFAAYERKYAQDHPLFEGIDIGAPQTRPR